MDWVLGGVDPEAVIVRVGVLKPVIICVGVLKPVVFWIGVLNPESVGYDHFIHWA